MPARENTADYYLRPPGQTFWQWQDGGEVVAWADGRTIAFRRELAVVVERLRAEELPPLGAILLLLAACRDNWSEPPSRLGLLAGLAATGGHSSTTTLLREVGPELDRVSALDSDLLHSPRGKAELAAMVFTGVARPRETVADIDRLCGLLTHGLPEECLLPAEPPDELPSDTLFRSLLALSPGLSRVDKPALESRLTTGIDREILPAAIDLPEIQSARELVGRLQDHAELGGVARVAQRLLGIVHLPTPLSQPEELPLGGVSDIANRGALDRLLVSELAQDDWTLAARVANNEALYLRRETPPHVPTRRRLVLLDCGLRMWGVPRVFATGVALAVAAQGSSRLDVAVYRAHGDELVPVETNSAAGLLAHLAVLDHRAHPGAALSALASLYAETGEAADVVLVTGEDVAADRDFQGRLGEAGLPEIYLATVGRDGHFRLFLRSRGGRKLLQEATLELDELLAARPRPTAPLVDLQQPTELPAIFAADPFPLRLSAPVDRERSWHVQDFGALTYTADGRLLHWDTVAHGARQLAEGLPRGVLHCANARMRDERIYAVLGPSTNGFLETLVIRAQRGSLAGVWGPVPLDVPALRRRTLFLQEETVFVAADRELLVCNLLTGERLAAAPLASFEHQRGAFFTQHSGAYPFRQWFRAAFDGFQVRWELVYAESNARERLLTMFDVEGQESPVSITVSGRLYSAEYDHYRLGHYPDSRQFLQVDGVSRDGHWVLLTTKTALGRQQDVLDVKTLAMHTCPNPRAAAAMLEPALHAAARPAVLRHRFQGIGIDRQKRLVLVGRRDSCWPLVLDAERDLLLLPGAPQAVQLIENHTFELVRPRHRYELAAATLANGAVAILDSRGLLHLKSPEARMPQCTIVLAEEGTAGWTSDGWCWGPEYFIGQHRRKRVDWVYHHVLRPLLESSR